MNTDNSIHLIGRIREKANHFIIEWLAQLGVHGVVPSHGDILATLFQSQELTMTEIARNIHRDRSTVTILVNKLINLGYVKSVKNPADSRSSLISLTKQGKQLEPGFRLISEKLYEMEYRGINNEEKEIFLHVLEKIHNNL